MNSENLDNLKESLKKDLSKNFDLFLSELENIVNDEDKLTLLKNVKKKKFRIRRYK